MKQIYFTLACLLILALAACHKETTTTNNQVVNNKPTAAPLILMQPTVKPDPSDADGFGYSNKPVKGLAFVFPVGVSLSGRVTTNINSCTSSSFYECLTDGDLPFYMSLRNNNNAPAAVIFPAGTVIPSNDSTLQNAVLVQPDTVIIPATTTICINLNAQCLNDHRGFNNNIAYGTPMISTNSNLLVLINLLATKKTIAYDNNQIIQQAVWDIANTGKMTAADISAINIFP